METWALGVLFTLICGAYAFTFGLWTKLAELAAYVYKLPCAQGDVEGRIDKLEQRWKDFDTKAEDAIGFKYDGNDESTDNGD